MECYRKWTFYEGAFGEVYKCTGEHHRSHDCEIEPLSVEEARNMVAHIAKLEQRVRELEEEVEEEREKRDMMQISHMESHD